MIPGITTRSRLPRLGKVRLGEKRTNAGGKEYPAALDHFSFVDVPEVEKVFGATCTELYPVLFPHDDEEVFFPTARKAYRATGLFCACDDGETARRVRVDKDEQGLAHLKAQALDGVVKEGEMFEMPCPGEECPFMEQKFCKNIGRLLFMLPTVPRFGVYEITTSSYNGIVNVLSVARAIKTQTGGRLAGIPFALTLKPQQAQVNGKAKTVHVLGLEFRGSLFDLQRANRELAGGRVVALLPEPGEDLPEDLYANGGQSLDDKLAGRAPAAPAAQASPRVIQMPRRVEAAPEPAPAASAPAPEAAQANGHQTWTGVIWGVAKRAKQVGGRDVWDVNGADAKVKYSTLDPDVKLAAETARDSKQPVEITFETQKSGARRILSMRPAGQEEPEIDLGGGQ
jgi:hypothetical protein